MTGQDNIEAILGVTVAKGQQGPSDLLSVQEGKELAEIVAKPAGEARERLLKKASRYLPSDPGHPWRDPYV